MKQHRLFFALWPSEEVRQSIADARSKLYPSVDGRRIPPDNYHITLHFVGSVTGEIKQCMHEAAQSVIAESFSLTLDHYGCFDKAKVFWMGSNTVPPALTRLHENLGKAITPCEYRCETRPYHPHVSLLRKAKSTQLDYPDFSINWQVNDFVLVESISTEDGVRYEVVARYSFMPSTKHPV